MDNRYFARLRNSSLGALCGLIAFGSQAHASAAWVTFSACNFFFTSPISINDHNVILGSCADGNGHTHGFLRAPDGTITTFNYPDATSGTYPVGMDAAGDVAGSVDTSSGHLGFLRTPDGAFSTFQYKSYVQTVPTAVNARGAIVGTTSDNAGLSEGFLRAADGTFTSLGNYTMPTAINARGVITGTIDEQGFVRTAAGTTVIFHPQGWSSSQPRAINASGAIVGSYVSDGIYHGFLRDRDGTMTTFDAPGAGTVGSAGTVACGINAKGTIVGFVWDNNFIEHGFVREPSGVMHAVDVPGSNFTSITAIAPSGKLIGNSDYHGFRALSGVWRNQ